MVRATSWRLAGAGFFLLLAGCIPIEEAEVLQRDIRRLQADVATLKDTSEGTEGGKRTALQEVETLQTELKRLQETQADLETRLQSALQSTATATGDVEETQFLANKTARELDELKEGLQGRLEALERDLLLVKNNLGFRSTVPPTTPAESLPFPPVEGVPPALGFVPDGGPEAVAPIPPHMSEERRLYDDALELALGGNLSEARRELEGFLTLFPKSEFADDAQYSIGETYFTQKRYEKAILEFDKVVINYETGDRIASALLKQGYAFLALGDETSARQLLTQVIDQHPDSPEAEEALSKLEDL